MNGMDESNLDKQNNENNSGSQINESHSDKQYNEIKNEANKMSGLLLMTTNEDMKRELNPYHLVWYIRDVNKKNLSPAEKKGYLKFGRDELKKMEQEYEGKTHSLYNDVLCEFYRELKRNTKLIEKRNLPDVPDYESDGINTLVLTTAEKEEKLPFKLDPFVDWLKKRKRKISAEERLGYLDLAEHEIEQKEPEDKKAIGKIYGKIEKNRKKIKKRR